MIVYVESNFVLELALEQEQHQSCQEIVALCEAAHAQLIIPAFCIAEPYETLGRRARERVQLKTSLADQINLLSRSQAYQKEINTFHDVDTLLIKSGEEENRRLHQTLDGILKVAEIIPLGLDILTAAAQFQSKFDFKPPDSIVYASVLQHLSKAEPGNKCFLNRNLKDFDDPDIEASLGIYNCKMLFRFDTGLGYVKSQIGF